MEQEQIELLIRELSAISSAINQSGPFATWTLTVAALAVSFLGLSFAGSQLWLIRRQLAADHERSRRKEALNAVQYYISTTKPEFHKSTSIFEGLPVSELKKIYEYKGEKGQEITIPHELINICCNVLAHHFPDISEKYSLKRTPIKLSHDEAFKLRHIMIDFLNHVEASLLPWHLGISDDFTTKKQFASLVSQTDPTQNSKALLADARMAVGNEKYPATMAFISEVLPNNEVPKRQDSIVR